MNYEKLYAAMKAEIKRRKLSRAQVAELAHVNSSTMESWFERAIKPQRDYTIKSFLALTDMLNINLDEFANHATLAGRLELLRWKNKLTCAELAKKAGVSHTVISAIEFRGFKASKKSSIEKIATALNTTPEWLLYGEGKKPVRNGLVMNKAMSWAESIEKMNLSEITKDFACLLQLLDFNYEKWTFLLPKKHSSYVRSVHYDCDVASIETALCEYLGFETITVEIIVDEKETSELENEEELVDKPKVGHTDTSEPVTGDELFFDRPVDYVLVDEPEPEQTTTMPQIIRKHIGGEDVKAVSARELHARLQSKQQFTDWIKNRIEKYDFVENVDFILHKIMKVQIEGNREVKREVSEYFVSIDMAKELSMVENNEAGKIARRYFIECEKVAKGEASTMEKPKSTPRIGELKQELIDSMEVLEVLGYTGGQAKLKANSMVKHSTGVDIMEWAGITDFVSEVQERYYTPSEIGMGLGMMSAQTVNNLLVEKGFQIKVGKNWIPTQKGKPFAVLLDTDKKYSNGTVQQIKWYESVKNHLAQ